MTEWFHISTNWLYGDHLPLLLQIKLTNWRLKLVGLWKCSPKPCYTSIRRAEGEFWQNETFLLPAPALRPNLKILNGQVCVCIQSQHQQLFYDFRVSAAFRLQSVIDVMRWDGATKLFWSADKGQALVPLDEIGMTQSFDSYKVFGSENIL